MFFEGLAEKEDLSLSIVLRGANDMSVHYMMLYVWNKE